MWYSFLVRNFRALYKLTRGSLRSTASLSAEPYFRRPDRLFGRLHIQRRTGVSGAHREAEPRCNCGAHPRSPQAAADAGLLLPAPARSARPAARNASAPAALPILRLLDRKSEVRPARRGSGGTRPRAGRTPQPRSLSAAARGDANSEANFCALGAPQSPLPSLRSGPGRDEAATPRTHRAGPGAPRRGDPRSAKAPHRALTATRPHLGGPRPTPAPAQSLPHSRSPTSRILTSFFMAPLPGPAAGRSHRARWGKRSRRGLRAPHTATLSAPWPPRTAGGLRRPARDNRWGAATRLRECFPRPIAARHPEAICAGGAVRAETRQKWCETLAFKLCGNFWTECSKMLLLGTPARVTVGKSEVPSFCPYSATSSLPSPFSIWALISVSLFISSQLVKSQSSAELLFSPVQWTPVYFSHLSCNWNL